MQSVNRKNICSVVCSYLPVLDKLNSLCKVLSGFSDVIIVDNARILDKSLYINYNNIKIFTPEYNLGTLKAYNTIIENNSSYDYFWLWDQDTALSAEASAMFLEKSFKELDSDDRLVVTTFFDKKNRINPFKHGQILIKGSTTFIDIRRLRKLSIGLFDQNLFMDYGDWDLSYRIQKAGGKILQIPGIIYEHSFGDTEKTIVGNLNRSSEIRLYIQGFNYSYLLKNRSIFSFINFLLTLRVIIIPFKNLLFKNSLKRTSLFFSGIIDGFMGNSSLDFIKRFESI